MARLCSRTRNRRLLRPGLCGAVLLLLSFLWTAFAPPLEEMTSLSLSRTANANDLSAEAPLPTRPPHERFLIIIDALEGISGWTNVLQDAARLARSLNRTLVEPCVRDGALVPCSLGRVVRTVDGSNAKDIEMAERGIEPDGNDTYRNHEARVFTLRAYYDWSWLTRNYPMIGYFEWLKLRVARAGTPNETAVAAGQHWINPKGGLVTRGAALVGLGSKGQACYNCKPGYQTAPVEFSGIVFLGHQNCPDGHGSITDPQSLFHSGVELASQVDVFVACWQRQLTLRHNVPWKDQEGLPPFNPVHYALVRHWVRNSVLGGPGTDDYRYGVVQWRSQSRTSSVSWCASEMSRVVSGVPSLAATNSSSRKRMVLVADLPSWANEYGIWDNLRAYSHEFGVRAEAAEQFFKAGFEKYDNAHWRLDAGIVAVRDAILALEATWYFGCSYHADPKEPRPAPDIAHASELLCAKCAYHSGFVGNIFVMRLQAGKRNLNRWYNLTAEYLQV